MNIKFKMDVVLPGGELVARTGDTGHVRAIANAQHFVVLDAPVTPKYPEISVTSDTFEYIKEAPVQVQRSPGFVLRIIGVEDVDLTAYAKLKDECSALDGVGAIDAVTKSLECMAVLSKLIDYKALLDFTVAEADRTTKLHYSKILSSKVGGSADTREASAKMDEEYQTKLSKLATLKAFAGYINDAFNYSMTMYYFFREVYKAEMKVPDDRSRGWQ